MIFTETPIAGVWLIGPERLGDTRGHFARTYSRMEFEGRGLDPRIDQCSTSFNRNAGTLRGMHCQAEPHGEAKLVRCTRGAIFDVALDLRPGSPTFRRWHGAELSEDNGCALFIPQGCAHGFQTLRDRTEIHYQISVPYVLEAAHGVRWDDPAFAIAWPEPPAHGRTMSERDATYPDVAP
jgi:dTDP-4-dehydrorhamnose 3,5-epimerase